MRVIFKLWNYCFRFCSYILVGAVGRANNALLHTSGVVLQSCPETADSKLNVPRMSVEIVIQPGESLPFRAHPQLDEL